MTHEPQSPDPQLQFLVLNPHLAQDKELLCNHCLALLGSEAGFELLRKRPGQNMDFIEHCGKTVIHNKPGVLSPFIAVLHDHHLRWSGQGAAFKYNLDQDTKTLLRGITMFRDIEGITTPNLQENLGHMSRLYHHVADELKAHSHGPADDGAQKHAALVADHIDALLTLVQQVQGKSGGVAPGLPKRS